MFKIITPGAVPVSTPGTSRCCISNIKPLLLPVLEKENFEDGLLCSYVTTCEPHGEPVLTPGASYGQTWKRSTMRSFITNVKALGLPVSEKKNFEVFFPCFYVPTYDSRVWVSFEVGGII